MSTPSVPPTTTGQTTGAAQLSERDAAVAAYKHKFLEHRDIESKVKTLRIELRTANKQFDKTEDDLKAVQNVGQIIAEVLKQLDAERFIVKVSSGPRYVVGCRSKVAANAMQLKTGTRVALDMTTLTIMRPLPREVDPMVFNMINEAPGELKYSDIGGLNDQIRELREVVELPLVSPELFKRVGIKPPKGVLLYGPPGTGKTLLARALANNIKATYLKVVASAIVDKYIGECFAKGTKILLANGESQAVELIQPGTRLVGDDGNVRVVMAESLVSGTGPLYEVSSANGGRDTWRCTGNHILVLQINARPIAGKLRDDWIIYYWDLAPARLLPTPTFKPFRRTLATGNTTVNGREESLKFDSKDAAEEFIETWGNHWHPLVFECTVEEYMQFNSNVKAVSGMFSPACGVSFDPPAVSLQARLEKAYGRTVSAEEVEKSAWTIGIWLTDGRADSGRICQIGDNIAKPTKSHSPVIQQLVMWRFAMCGVVTGSNKSVVESSILHGLDAELRDMAQVVVRFQRKSSSGNNIYNVSLGKEMWEVLGSYKMQNNKHLPHALLRESRAVRLALLAGIVDGDGYLNKVAGYMYEIPAKERKVLDGIIHLARGLGFSSGQVSVKSKYDEDKDQTYNGWRVNIGGPLHLVTTVLLYKQVPAAREVKYSKASLCNTVTIKQVGVSEWYGFQVDGNSRFLLDDFVVTHNSARIIREMFGYAKDHQPCIIFMDEVDAIGGRRFSQGTSADREIQRTLMELLNQLDGFDDLGKVKIVMATNRPDTLDPALLRPGRLDRKIEIPLPNESARLDILKIHAKSITKHGDIDYDAVVKLTDGFNGADLRNVCTEAGMFAIRAERPYVIEEDFMKAARKVGESKKLEGTLDYDKV